MEPHLSWTDRSGLVWVPFVRVSEGWARHRDRWPGGVPGWTAPPGRAAWAARWAGWARGYLKHRTSLGGVLWCLAARCPHSPSFVSWWKASHFRNGINRWMYGQQTTKYWKLQKGSPPNLSTKVNTFVKKREWESEKLCQLSPNTSRLFTLQ